MIIEMVLFQSSAKKRKEKNIRKTAGEVTYLVQDYLIYLPERLEHCPVSVLFSNFALTWIAASADDRQPLYLVLNLSIKLFFPVHFCHTDIMWTILKSQDLNIHFVKCEVKKLKWIAQTDTQGKRKSIVPPHILEREALLWWRTTTQWHSFCPLSCVRMLIKMLAGE